MNRASRPVPAPGPLGVRRVVEAPRRPDPADPEFDPAPTATVRLRDFDPIEHQRVLVNPFLAVLAVVAWWRLASSLFRGPFPPLAVLAALALAALPLLVQYHCLDCGRTGIYARLRRHACPGVQARWREGRRSRLPFPRARSQMIFWAYAIGSAALLAAVAGLPAPRR